MAKIIEESKLTLQDSLLTGRQIVKLLAPTPESQIKKLQGKYDYVNVYYVVKQLNHIFGYDWDYRIEVLDARDKQVVVKGAKAVLLSVNMLGTLTIRTPKGHKVIQQVGSSINDKDPFKSAASDALKKCASFIGIAIDVYSRVDGIELELEEQPTANDNAELENVLSFATRINSLHDYKAFINTKAYEKYKDDFGIKAILAYKYQEYGQAD